MCQSKRKGLDRFDLDELHFRAILAALITKDGPVRTDVFINRLAFFQEEVLQNHADDFINATLKPPSEPDSGADFAECALRAFKEGEASAWEMLANKQEH